MESPKERPLVLEEYIVAYFGDYLTMLEKSVEHIVDKEIKKDSNQIHNSNSIINTQKHQEQSPDAQ